MEQPAPPPAPGLDSGPTEAWSCNETVLVLTPKRRAVAHAAENWGRCPHAAGRACWTKPARGGPDLFDLVILRPEIYQKEIISNVKNRPNIMHRHVHYHAVGEGKKLRTTLFSPHDGDVIPS